MENTQLTLREVAGPLNDFLVKLLGTEGAQWMSAFKKFLRKENPWEKPLFKYDKAKDGWKLLENVEFSGAFVPDIVEFLKSRESYVNGEVMKQRAQELNAHLGQHHAEYLLEHQELIPKEWRGKYCLVFPGTVWQSPDGDRHVPYLHWSVGGWSLHFPWLEHAWHGYARLVSLRK